MPHKYMMMFLFAEIDAETTNIGHFNLSVEVLLINGSISICITWMHTGVSLMSHYALHLAHDGCQADPDYPGCDSPRDIHSFNAFALPDEVNATISIKSRT